MLHLLLHPHFLPLLLKSLQPPHGPKIQFKLVFKIIFDFQNKKKIKEKCRQKVD